MIAPEVPHEDERVVEFPLPWKRSKRTTAGKQDGLEPVVYYRPGVGYYRRDVITELSSERLCSIALFLVSELEQLQQWALNETGTMHRHFGSPDEAQDRKRRKGVDYSDGRPVCWEDGTAYVLDVEDSAS